MDSRRDFLKKAALLAGSAGLISTLPLSVQKALAIDPVKGSTFMDAEHVVILMQENRSFDHCFGTLRGVRGYNDPRAINLPDNNKVWLQSNQEGQTFAPFHLDINDTKATWMKSLPHSWSNQVNARNDGKHDQWLNVKRSGIAEYAHIPLTMGYHTRADLPFYYGLADAFTVCDQNFCSSLTGTSANRLFFWTGTIRQEQHENSRPLLWNDDADYSQLTYKTFPERLEENGISWKCYQNEMSIDIGFKGEQDAWLSNFSDNPMEYFGQFNINLHPPRLAHLKDQVQELSAKADDLQKKLSVLSKGDPKTVIVQKQLDTIQQKLQSAKKDFDLTQQKPFDSLTEHQKNIHIKAFATNINDADYHDLIDLDYDDNGVKRQMKVPKGDVLHQFRQDVQTGKLPTVSWLVPPENFSDHPTAPWYGAWYTSEVMDILTKDPEVWKKTIFIITYDENDGYFDHIPPFVAPHTSKPETGKASGGMDTRVEYVTLQQELERKDFPEKYNRESPIGLGYRVPMIVASPWSRGGYVNSEVFDHTSTLQFLEYFLSAKTGKNIRETNTSDWRRTVCGDLTSVFQPDTPAAAATPEPIKKDRFLKEIHNAKFKKLPEGYVPLTKAQIAAANQNPLGVGFMPKQEQGVRKACAIPYQLTVNGGLSTDKTKFGISFAARNDVFDKAAAGSPFNVYAPGRYLQKNANGEMAFEPVKTWAYAVKPGEAIKDEWALNYFENNRYHLRVYGPNGYFREFKGDAQDPQLTLLIDDQHVNLINRKLTGNIELKLANHDGRSHQVQVIDNAYKTNHQIKTIAASASQTIVLDLQSSHNWYDFTIVVRGHVNFEKRYAGHVETGANSYSDPFMGGVV